MLDMVFCDFCLLNCYFNLNLRNSYFTMKSVLKQLDAHLNNAWLQPFHITRYLKVDNSI